MFNIKEKYSHMPFVAHGPNGQTIELCCLKRNGVWKVHYFDNGIWRKLATYTNDDAYECCPTAEWDLEECKWIITFISGGSTMNDWKDVEFWLYKKYGFDDSKPIKVVPADVGFIEKGNIVFASKIGPVFIYDYNETKIITLTDDLKFIYRLNYDPKHRSRLLISGKLMNEKLISFIYDTDTEKAYVLTDGDKPCYKCCFDKQDVYYCERHEDERFDDRHIVKASNPKIVEVDAKTLIKDVATTEENIIEGEL